MATTIERQIVFLTGATGAMGLAVTRALTAAGHEVRGVTRSAEGAATLKSLGATPVEVDLFDPRAVRTAMRGSTSVAHFATKIPMGFAALKPGAWAENDRLRIEATRNLLAAAAENGVGQFIFESFYGAYPHRGEDWIDEEVPLQPTAGFMKSIVDAEAMVNEFGARYGGAVVLRFARIYGAGRASDAFTSMVQKRQMPVVGAGANFVSSVHIDDVGSAVLHALTVSAGTYNVADDEPMRQAEYNQHVAQVLGARPPRRFPAVAARIMMGRAANALVASQRISNRRFREATGWHPRYRSAREGWVAVARLVARASLEAEPVGIR
jgi:nucleoside-diphosphate-sugar epimerase